MVRTPSAAGRLRPHLRESIISFRMDDDSDEEMQTQREPSITGIYDTLGADVHCLSRTASPAAVVRSPPSPANAQRSSAASPARWSAPRAALVTAPFVLSPPPLAAPVVLSPPQTRTRGLAPMLSMADEILKKSAKT